MEEQAAGQVCPCAARIPEPPPSPVLHSPREFAQRRAVVQICRSGNEGSLPERRQHWNAEEHLGT